LTFRSEFGNIIQGVNINPIIQIRPEYRQVRSMKASRRSFGALILGGIATAATGSAAPGAIAASAERHPYPALAALAALFPDKPSCVRLAKAGLGDAFDSAALAALDAALRPHLAAGIEPAAVLAAQNAADFRAKQTVVAGGFTLARTEAAAILLRARPDLARARV
jgi:hypothetical protein